MDNSMFRQQSESSEWSHGFEEERSEMAEVRE